MFKEVVGDATRSEDGSDVRCCQSEGGSYSRFPLLNVFRFLVVGLLVVAVKQTHPVSASKTASATATSFRIPGRYVVPEPFESCQFFSQGARVQEYLTGIYHEVDPVLGEGRHPR